jgi:hypothetical protein
VDGGTPARRSSRALVGERDFAARQAAKVVPGVGVVTQPVPAQRRLGYGHQVLEQPRERGYPGRDPASARPGSDPGIAGGPDRRPVAYSPCTPDAPSLLPARRDGRLGEGLYWCTIGFNRIVFGTQLSRQTVSGASGGDVMISDPSARSSCRLSLASPNAGPSVLSAVRSELETRRPGCGSPCRQGQIPVPGNGRFPG